LDTVERHIEQAEKKLDRVHHRENSIEKKNAISDLEVFIKIQKSKTVSLKKNIKNCEQLEEKKKKYVNLALTDVKQTNLNVWRNIVDQNKDQRFVLIDVLEEPVTVTFIVQKRTNVKDLLLN